MENKLHIKRGCGTVWTKFLEQNFKELSYLYLGHLIAVWPWYIIEILKHFIYLSVIGEKSNIQLFALQWELSQRVHGKVQLSCRIQLLRFSDDALTSYCENKDT